ncbi:hypothetical protein HGA34_01990 [Candidatus Falkowbacteria bacterium]|nr:hypothetical protein [Candidatus Falkowbacteria bacterium]
MKKAIKKLKDHKIKAVVFLLFCASLFLGQHVYAVSGEDKLSTVFGAVGVAVTTVVGIFAYLLTTVFGLALTAMAALLVQVALYSDIINVPAVREGWVIIRDLCNMFFVLIFLIIAFATILRIENYSAKRLLPKLIIMAILINFSKTIFGLLIDFSQIVMLTFVVAFKNGGGWFMDAFRVQKWYSFNMNDKDSSAATQWGTVVAMVLSVFAAAVALIMVMVILAVLVIRIVMLWIYTILSPFVFLGWAFPPVGKYTEQIWTDFIKQLIVGPVLAFFLWLALAFGTASSSTMSLSASSTEVCAGVSGMFCTGELQKFIIMLGMMVGGLITAQSVGGAGAKAVNWGTNKIKSGQAWAGNKFNRGFQDVTRISAAKEYYSQYRASKEGARTEKIQLQANQMAYGVGKAKEMTVGKVSGFATEQWGRFGGNSAKKLRDTNNKDRVKMQELNEGKGLAFEKAKDRLASNMMSQRTVTIGNERYGRTGTGWTDNTGRYFEDGAIKEKLIKTDQFKAQLTPVIQQRQATLQRHMDRRESLAQSAQARQKRFDRLGKLGLAATLGAATGGAALAGGALAASAGLGAVAAAPMAYGSLGEMGKRFKGAGKTDGNLVSKFRIEQITKAKGDMKDDNHGTVLANINDESKSAFVRLAAVMEAMDRHLLSQQDVNRYRNIFQGKLGGPNVAPDAAAQPWADKKINSRFEAIVDKNYKGASLGWHTAQDQTPGKQDDARRAQLSIQDDFASGDVKLKDLGVDALRDSINQLALGMKNGQFVKEYKDLNPAKQQALIDALDRNTTYEAKAKLAFVTNIQRAFRNDQAGATRFMQGLSVKQIKEIFEEESDPAKTNAIRSAVGGDQNNLSQNVRLYINGNSAAAQQMRADLGVGQPAAPNPPQNQNQIP